MGEGPGVLVFVDVVVVVTVAVSVGVGDGPGVGDEVFVGVAEAVGVAVGPADPCRLSFQRCWHPRHCLRTTRAPTSFAVAISSMALARELGL